MVHFLVFEQSIENCFLDRTHRPEHSPASIVVFVGVPLGLFYVSETVVFKRESYYLDVTVVQVEVITSVLRRIRPYCDGVFVRPEHKKIAFNLLA